MRKIPPSLRDELARGFRVLVCERLGFVPFVHQAAWWAASDGWTLQDRYVEGLPSVSVRHHTGDVGRRSLRRRPGGQAKVIAELAAYKAGKSAGGAMWMAGFAAVPNARVVLIGNEYDMTTPEFDYLLEALCSERGMNLTPASLQNRPKDGRLWLELQNGARYEARSWERSESLKGKEVDCYMACEAYQLPGLEAYTSVRQNLRARKGYYVFTTTPDRPWVGELHERGHGHAGFPEWQCFCGIPARVNPFTFSEKEMAQAEQVMTREKFAIAYHGRLGDYVGRVYNHARGERVFTPESHPQLFFDREGPADRANFRLPSEWRVEIGADTGTFLASVVVGVDDEGRVYVLDELVNYSYLAGQPELDPAVSIVSWANAFQRMAALYRARPVAWCDSNSQFRNEFAHHRVMLMGNATGREARTESAREYFQHEKVLLAPWLKVLPYELEWARWPEHATASGKYERLKENDHALDALEHVLSRRPRATRLALPKEWSEWPPARRRVGSGNPHMGRY